MGSGQQHVLSAAQMRALRRLADSRHTPPYLVRRAEVVLDENRARSTGAARDAGVTGQTARKWFRRYLEMGPAGLEDAPRYGRPPATQDGAAQEILVAPLFADSPGWTSRSIAGATNCTQSAVARVWKRTFDDGRMALGGSLPTGGLALEACFSGLECSILMLRFEHGTGSDRTAESRFMRSPLRPALQTVLATDLLSRRATQTGATAARAGASTPKMATLSGVDAFVLECKAQFGDAMPGFALCTSESTTTLLHELNPAISVVVIDRDRWQGVLLELGPRMSSGSSEALSTAHHRAIEWARKQDGPFVWIHSAAPSAGAEPRPKSRPQIPLATSELVADSILWTLQRDILAGRLGGGDRITETYLSRSAHASRGHVRDALRVLAFRGIVELQPSRGAVVPRPGVDDVIETYAARRALGALIVRRAAESPLPNHLPLLEKALRNMLETAQTGDAWATGEDDLRFQEVMAEMTGMRRVPMMFSSLTAQLRMFVALLGLRYAYSIPDMCQDDIALLRLITDRNRAEAVSRWNSKMNDAANYMLQQLNPQAPLRR